MCIKEVKDVIRDVIEEWTDNNEMFTAFEVTLEVKKRLSQKTPLANVPRHRDIKGIIHSEMDFYIMSGAYNSDLQDVGAEIKATVYGPYSSDLSQYKPLKRDNKIVDTTPKTADVTSAIKNPIGLRNPATPVTHDSRWTICIPNEYVRGIGLAPGSIAYAYPNKAGTITISKNKPLNDGKSTKYTVDKYNNIRVTSAVLRKLGKLSNQYEVHASADNIIVTKG